jgi:hypothetical protein
MQAGALAQKQPKIALRAQQSAKEKPNKSLIRQSDFDADSVFWLKCIIGSCICLMKTAQLWGDVLICSR